MNAKEIRHPEREIGRNPEGKSGPLPLSRWRLAFETIVFLGACFGGAIVVDLLTEGPSDYVATAIMAFLMLPFAYYGRKQRRKNLH